MRREYVYVGSAGMFCEGCGAELEAGSRFCGECGSRVSDGGAIPSSRSLLQVRPPRRSRFFRVRGLIAAILVALVFSSVLWLVFRPAKAGLVDVAKVLPENTAVLISFRDPVTHWEAIEKSNFYKTVQATEVWQELLRELKADRGFPDTHGIRGHNRRPPIEEAINRLCNQLG